MSTGLARTGEGVAEPEFVGGVKGRHVNAAGPSIVESFRPAPRSRS